MTDLLCTERAAPRCQITCRDTDDSEYWLARLNAADREDCEALLDAMFGLGSRLYMRCIPHAHVADRQAEGMRVFAERFGEPFVPF